MPVFPNTATCNVTIQFVHSRRVLDFSDLHKLPDKPCKVIPGACGTTVTPVSNLAKKKPCRTLIMKLL